MQELSNIALPTDYQAFIHTSRYARWIEDEERRETWAETVERFMENVVVGKVDAKTEDEIRFAILNLEVMPSMRAMMTAGPALMRDNTCGYNCSYLPVDDVKSFDEAMFILLCGTGVGFSVERQYVQKLPEVPEKLFDSETTILVKDSKEGWAKALRMLIALLYAGEIPSWDVSRVRPAGAKLKTFGGRASGPGPLVDLFQFVINTFKEARGRKLSSIECHDIMCKIGQIVVVGGVRRSAMISLSNLSDDRMRHAKTGQFPEHRYLSNNSVAYTEKPDAMSFLREWTALAESGSGERGIVNREAMVKQAKKIGRDPDHEWGTNPCSEIQLRPYQFCNLSEVVIRATDTEKDLLRKVRLATILGTIQSTFTKFPYLRKVWQRNTEEERLLGVSLTGIMDNTLTNGKEGNLPKLLEKLNDEIKRVNEEYANKLGIPVSAARSCCKPSGTVSQLVDSASGIHARHSEYYIRTVRGDNNDPLTQFMKDQGIPSEPCVYNGDSTTVFSFPVKAPVGAVTRHDMTAVEQLEMWLTYMRHFTDHKPSVTVTVRADEWFEVGHFVYTHFDEMSGVSFLPMDDHIYQQAPYQDIGKSDYEKLNALMPKSIDWSLLKQYETEDGTKSSQTLACTGDVCEIVDISA
jgi:ribonucleoside-diphosphate reductase alpha chain